MPVTQILTKLDSNKLQQVLTSHATYPNTERSQLWLIHSSYLQLRLILPIFLLCHPQHTDVCSRLVPSWSQVAAEAPGWPPHMALGKGHGKQRISWCPFLDFS